MAEQTWTLISPNGRYATVDVKRWPIVATYLRMGWTLLIDPAEIHRLRAKVASEPDHWAELCARTS